MGFVKRLKNKYWKHSFGYALYKTTTAKSAKAFSQWGEDILIDHFLLMPEFRKKSGFYVDVGCNNPRIGNNFYRLYQKGWSGINIDMMERNIKLCRSIRKRDTNLLTGVSSEAGEVNSFVFSKSFSLNSLDKSFADKWAEILKKNYEIAKIPVKPLDLILDENASGRKIDILSIDVEGHELSVLQGFTISKFSPTLVLCEIHGHDMEEVIQTEAYTYFKQNSYRLVSRCGGTCFFVPNEYDCGF
ncbi:MAG: FkbM family methyltransferase [Thalassospira sp.]|uniref:FkbM family methyltransferase n=1 Tax=Thalassospira sp. TaxID=1912094 RepID=UPI003A8C0556